MRIINQQQAAFFLPDLYKLHKKFIDKTGDKYDESLQLLNYFTETCSHPYVLFLVAIDENYKCMGYLIASILEAVTKHLRQIFIWHLYMDDMDKRIIDGGWKIIIDYAKSMNVTKIGAFTRSQERIFARWCRRFGLTKESTFFSMEINNG